MTRVTIALLSLGLLATGAHTALGAKAPAVVGRWNLTLTGPDGVAFPSWLEVTDEGGSLRGRLCGRFGSAHPLARVELQKSELTFVDASGPQDKRKERVYRARLKSGRLEGTSTAEGEGTWTFTAVRAPRLREPRRIKWGKPIPLITKGLTGWRLRGSAHGACWKEADGVLSNAKPCVDIISDGKYENFKLHLEFKLEEPKANSGVYLRGRYEVQINDDKGQPPESHAMGALYGLITPGTNAAMAVGEWQTYEISLMGRKVTVVLNGQTVIDGQEIPGPTGGALDADEALPGPLMLQGDHGRISYRNITITPAL